MTECGASGEPKPSLPEPTNTFGREQKPSRRPNPSGPQRIYRIEPMAIRRRHSRPGVSPAVRLLLSATLASGCDLGLPSSLRAQPNPNLARLTFTKLLKGSSPEYMAIVFDSNGLGTYEGRKLDDPPDPRPLRLSPATTRRLFELAASLNHFKSIDLESHKKVANLGWKTFTYEEGDERNRAEFNYTLRREAQQMTDLFERIASVEQHIVVLEYAIKYDHLSLPRELLQIKIDLDSKALADAELMVPALEQIARNPKFLRLAQVRAQNILERLRNND